VFAIPAFALSVGIKILKSAEETAAIKAESAQYRKQIEWQRAENEGYAAILEQANPVAFENYVLRTAREKLGLSLPGDKVYVDPAAASAATK
jgi:cell division protein FtsB